MLVQIKLQYINTRAFLCIQYHSNTDCKSLNIKSVLNNTIECLLLFVFNNPDKRPLISQNSLFNQSTINYVELFQYINIICKERGCVLPAHCEIVDRLTTDAWAEIDPVYTWY